MPKTHCKSYTPEYKAWIDMKTRCYNKNRTQYKDWGGRGIIICFRWRFSFENFLEDMGHRSDGMSLDRIDNEKGYYPLNCHWATRTEQRRNGRFLRLSMDKAREIRFCNNILGFTQREIADIFGVYQGRISEVVTGKTWKEVPH